MRQGGGCLFGFGRWQMRQHAGHGAAGFGRVCVGDKTLQELGISAEGNFAEVRSLFLADQSFTSSWYSMATGAIQFAQQQQPTIDGVAFGIMIKPIEATYDGMIRRIDFGWSRISGLDERDRYRGPEHSKAETHKRNSERMSLHGRTN